MMPRRPWIAAVLSLFCTGLGHMYAGRADRGATLFLLRLLILPVSVVVALLPPSPALLAVFVLTVASGWLIWLAAVVDAYLLAGRNREGIVLRRWNHTGVYALAVVLGLAAPVGAALLMRISTFDVYRIPTMSLAPTLESGDRILVNRMVYRKRPPARWELAVFVHPTDRSKTHVKRVVGLPGDRIDSVDGRLVINGKSVPGPRGEVMGPRFNAVVVPPGGYWMLGDNRGNSWDSRQYGFVPAGNLVGAAQYLMTSLVRCGMLDAD